LEEDDDSRGSGGRTFMLPAVGTVLPPVEKLENLP
jgi:hypothetical protein